MNEPQNKLEYVCSFHNFEVNDEFMEGEDLNTSTIYISIKLRVLLNIMIHPPIFLKKVKY